MTSIRIFGRLAAAVAVIGTALYGGSLLAAEGDALRALDKRADGSAILNLVVTDGPLEPPPIVFTDEAGEELSLADFRGTARCRAFLGDLVLPVPGRDADHGCAAARAGR